MKTSLGMVLLLLYGELVMGSVCLPGDIGAPASFDGVVRPATAMDINPDPTIVEVNLTARPAVWNFGTAMDSTVWTYNGVIPGPTLEANVGDTLVVNFCNDLPEETTIHWHGVETPANMDGSHIAQLTVPTFGTFRYEFRLLRPGTYWYHPHFQTHRQVEMGLHGALVVRDPIEDALLGLPANEHILVLDDVLLDANDQIVGAFVGGKESVALEKLNGREGDTLLINGVREPTLNLSRSAPHRFRLINAANSRFMRVSLDGHNLTQIGGDQGLLEGPIEFLPLAAAKHTASVDGLTLTPGERADVVINPNQALDSALLRWFDYPRGRHTVDFDPDGSTVSLGHAHDDGVRAPLTLANVVLTVDGPITQYQPGSRLRPVPTIDAEGATTLPLVMGHTVPNWDTGDVTFFIQAPGKPFAALTAEDVHTVLANGTYIWEIRNLTGGAHNFHTHGFHFQFLDTQFVDNEFPDDLSRNYTITADHVEDKDTILIPARPGAKGSSFSLTRLAVVFDDAGREGQIGAHSKVASADESGGWLAHCHLLEHSASGMMTFFQVDQLFDDGFEDPAEALTSGR